MEMGKFYIYANDTNYILFRYDGPNNNISFNYTKLSTNYDRWARTFSASGKYTLCSSFLLDTLVGVE